MNITRTWNKCPKCGHNYLQEMGISVKSIDIEWGEIVEEEDDE